MTTPAQVASARILSHWSDLEWRHHGAGLLQAYIPGTQSRVHIWSSQLLRPGMADSGAWHNHRFHLRSLVLYGELLHTTLVPVPDDNGTHVLWRIVGAAQARGGADMVEGDRVSVLKSAPTRYCGNESYCLLKWDYHWARVPAGGFAITFVDMVDKEGSDGAPRADEKRWASLICPQGQIPVAAFTDEPLGSDEWSIMWEAHNHLNYLASS